MEENRQLLPHWWSLTQHAPHVHVKVFVMALWQCNGSIPMQLL